MSKGSILTIRKDQLHKFRFNKHLKGYILMFTNDFLVSYLEQIEFIKTLQLFNEQLSFQKLELNEHSFTIIEQLVNRMGNEYFSLNDEYSLVIIRSELHILITQLFRIKMSVNQFLKDKKYLSEFISFQKLVDTNITKTRKVIDYAKQLGMSTKTLNAISKTIVNKTAKEFIDEIGILQIKRMLINTKLSIQEVAFSSGFEETTNFYKYFKRALNTTPESFRKHHIS